VVFPASSCRPCPGGAAASSPGIHACGIAASHCGSPGGTTEEALRGYYEPQDWLQTITIKAAGGGTYDQWTYYPTDAAGNADLTGRIHREIDPGGRLHAFWYNKRYELTQDSDPNYLGTVPYGYDLNGNRISRMDNSGTDYYGVDANNKLLWVNHGTNAAPTSGQAGAYMLFNYDLNGNMTHRERRFLDGTFQSYDLLWDGADNLRRINVHGGSEIWAAGYNGDGLRVSLQDTASGSFPTQHNFSWGLGGLLYDVYQSAVYTPGVSQNVSGADTFFHTDWLGSTRYLSDSTGSNFPSALRYDAFGNRIATGGAYDPSPFQFAGGWGYQSEFATGTEQGTGLQYLEQRYYDPAIGRFISADPLGFGGGTNLYDYSDNDPVNEVDPSGLISRQQVANGLRNARNAFLNGVNWILATPGRVAGWAQHRFFTVTLQPGTPTLGTANPAAYPELKQAGKEINRFLNKEQQDIFNQLFYGIVAGVGAGAGGEDLEAEAKALDQVRELGPGKFNQDIIGLEQRPFLKEFLGGGVKGLEERLRDFYVPDGLSRETLIRYRAVALHALEERPGDVDVQVLQRGRIEIIDRALRELGR
jgi:RHS repeat-associated protein